MNETRNIIVGLEIGREQSQICYYDRREKEPISISVKAGSNQYFFPTLLSKKPEEGIWHYGLEAEYFSTYEGEIRVSDFLEICEKEEETELGGQRIESAVLMEQYLTGCVSLLGTADPARQIKALMITVPKISSAMVKAVYQAGENMGFSRKQIWLQDYDESFYYYVMNHRKDNRSRKIACFMFDHDKVSFAKLLMEGQKRPVMAHMEHGDAIELPQEPQERDDRFHQFIEDSCKGERYFSIYLVGEGFSQDWAVRSILLLGAKRPHIFYGNNLYVKGACYGAMEKCETEDLRGFLYLSPSLVKNNVAMEMVVNGSPKVYPLAEAGKNWYEIYTQMELILDEKEDLEFLVMPMEGGNKIRYSMKLPGLPKRPNKTTRLRVSISYESAELCVIRAEDMGFGELFPAEDKVWTERVSW